MKFLLYLSFILLSLTFSYGQQLPVRYKATTIQGIVVDSSLNRPISLASVSVLYAKDSILYDCIRTDINGKFVVKDLDTGKFILMIAYTGYADYIEYFSVTGTSGPIINFNKLPIVRKSTLLSEVIIKSEKISAIRINGDTLEFKADSFKVQPNAKVEDLLRQLPNIQVDKNGKIYAEGQVVKTVLVDGEEFFGDDPTLITKNIRADIVDKIQVYDKTSKQAAFTGIDDGVKNKTINIKLKEDKKNGYFGNVEAGAGNDKLYEGQVMLNVFRDKEKFAVYGLSSNNGVVGLSWQDDQNFETGSVGGGLDTWDGNYNGRGIPTVQTAGAHYDNKWGDGKYYINGNYKAANLNIEGDNHTVSQYSLPNGVNYSTSDQQTNNHSLRNKAAVSMDINPNINSSFNIAIDALTEDKNSTNKLSQQTVDQDNPILNKNSRTFSTTGDGREFNSSLLWNKKLAKKGRTLSVNLSEQYDHYNSQGYLNSETDFYNNTGIVDSAQKTDQLKIAENAMLNINAKIIYTEPISPFSTLTGSYGTGIQNSKGDIISYNKSSAGIYNNLDSLNSSSYVFNQLQNRIGLAYNFDNKKTLLNFSDDLETNHFSQVNKFNSGQLNRQFVNWYPQIRFRYQFTSGIYLALRYNGQTIIPTINQLQPVFNNIDPLNLYVGNTGLNPSYRNSFNLLYRDYSPLNRRSFLINSTYTFTNHPIVVNTQTDSTGKNINTYTNLANTGTTELNTYGFYSIRIKSLDMMFTSNAGVILDKYINFINQKMNIAHSNSYTTSLSISKSKNQNYAVSLAGSIKYNSDKTSLDPAFNNNYWSYWLSNTDHIYFPKTLQLHTDFDYHFQQKTSAFNTDLNQLIVSAWIGKRFFKNNILVKLAGNDLLNKNSGFSRFANNNVATQSSYTTIRRNFMVSVTYDLNKTINPK